MLYKKIKNSENKKEVQKDIKTKNSIYFLTTINIMNCVLNNII